MQLRGALDSSLLFSFIFISVLVLLSLPNRLGLGKGLLSCVHVLDPREQRGLYIYKK